MAYVISGTSATEEVRQLNQNQPADWFAHPDDSPGTGKPGSLIGSPVLTIRARLGRQDCRGVSLTLSS